MSEVGICNRVDELKTPTLSRVVETVVCNPLVIRKALGHRCPNLCRRVLPVSRTCVRIESVDPPEAVECRIDAECCVVCKEYNFILDDIVRRIPWIEITTSATEYPQWRWTFLAINHPATVGIGVTPICTCDIFNTIWNTITIGIDRIPIIARIVLWIRTIEIFLAVPNTTCIRICNLIIRNIRIGTTVA